MREKDNKTIKNIYMNYCDMEKALVKELNFKAEHSSTIGGYREDVWKSLFEQIIPKKFSIERSVFIIDSYGNVSNEVDLAIFDEQYTPYIFRYGTLKFIPIEAVAVVIECKSSSINIDDWSESIDNLKTSYNSVARIATGIITNNAKQLEKIKKQNECKVAQTSTRPIKILCCVKNTNINNKKKEDLNEKFDFIIHAKEGEERLIITCKNQNQKLLYWHNDLNHNGNGLQNEWPQTDKQKEQNISLEQYSVDGNSILTLIFQLNQLLMLINNPLLFPHMSYVKLFNKSNSKFENQVDKGGVK